MKIQFILSTLIITTALSACTQSVPKCGDSQVTTLVSEIADEQMATQVGEETANMLTYTVEAIRTTNTNELTGSHECAADLIIGGNNGEEVGRGPITYTVENTDDGESIYVSVFGL